MSLQRAQLWLQKHPDSIPAMGYNHQKIIDLLDSENNSQDVVSYAAADPGFSLALLKKVNANRGANTGMDIVESTKSAISLLGNKVAHTLLKEFSVAENTLDNPQQLFLYQQIINRSFHNEIQVTEWARENGYQHIEQLRAAALLSYIGEALCCIHDFEHYLNYIIAGSPENEEQKYLGFSFSHLTETLCQKLNLPKIIIQALPHKDSLEQREKFLFFITKLCQQCEHGWYTENISDTFQQFSTFLQNPDDQIITEFHQIAVQAANQSIIPDAWQAASRLLLIQDQAWTPPASDVVKQKKNTTAAATDKTIEASKKPATETAPKTSSNDDVFIRMKRLLQQHNVSKADILNACLNGLFEDFSMSKASLLLLSQDKKKLHNRLTRGVEKGSAFSQYQVETSSAGLFKILLNKPQAIWINDTNLKKYEKLIPPGLLTSVMTSNFLAMSLFIGEKPIGIVYADRTDSTDKIDKEAFTQYKQLISLTSKALTFLSKK